MFEEETQVKNMINPESINPHYVKRPESKPKEEYEDTPEYRKSLNLKVHATNQNRARYSSQTTINDFHDSKNGLFMYEYGRVDSFAFLTRFHSY